MLKNYVLIPIAAIIGVGAAVPASTYHVNLVHARIVQQQKQQQAEKQHQRELAKQKQIAKQKEQEKLANRYTNMNVQGKNKQITVKVTQMSTGQVLYTGGKHAKNRFVLLQLSIKNNSNSAIMFQQQDFTLKTSKGTFKQAKGMLSNKAVGKSIINKPIAVGSTMTAYIAFDAKGANENNKVLSITNNYNNMWSKPLQLTLTVTNSSGFDSDNSSRSNVSTGKNYKDTLSSKSSSKSKNSSSKSSSNVLGGSGSDKSAKGSVLGGGSSKSDSSSKGKVLK